MRFLNVFALGAVALTLTACGGGGSGTSTASPSSPSTTTSSVALASSQLVTQTQAQPVAGTSTTASAFDLTADIGDTWRIVLNQDGTFSLQVLVSQFNLQSITGTYTVTTSGDFKILTGTGSNSADTFQLKLDTRTKQIVGRVTLGGRTTTAAGSGYAVPTDLTKLAGTYFYVRGTRNALDGGSPDFGVGTFKIAANGTDVTVCDAGFIDAAGNCQVPAGSSTPVATVSLSLVQKNGLTYIVQNGQDFGILNFQAGDRGPVLLIDRFGPNDQNILRTGAFYAVKQQALQGNEADGNWECADRGVVFGGFTANGSALQASDGSSETLNYNKGSTSIGLVSVNGIASSVAKGQPDSSGVVVLPLSSSLIVVEREQAQSVGVCRRAS